MTKLPYKVSILNQKWLTPDILRLELEKPDGYTYSPGQALELTIDDPAFHTDFAPFTITNLDQEPTIELILKVYPSHNGMTLALSKCAIGDMLFISQPWDSFPYLGKGVFIAAGAGITAFLPIIRSMAQQDRLGNHQLIWANRKFQDLFLEEALQQAFSGNMKLIFSKARSFQHSFGHINQAYLKQTVRNFNQYFYICGPGHFPDQVKDHLVALGASPERIRLAY